MILVMLRTALHISKHTLRTLLEISIGVIVAFAFLLAVLTWQFSKGPVNVSWVKPYLQQAITEGDPNMSLRTGSIIAEWPHLTEGLSLGVSDFELFYGTRKIIDMDSVGIRLSKAALLLGQIAPEAIILKQPSLKIIRDPSGEFRLSLATKQDEKTDSELKPFSMKDIGNSLFLKNGFLESSFLGLWSNLEVLDLSKADIITEDHISGVTWSFSNVNINLNRTEKKVDLLLSFPSSTANKQSQILVKAIKDRSGQTTINTNLNHVDVSLLSKLFSSLSIFSQNNMVLNGNIDGMLDKDWMVESLTGTIGTNTISDTLFSVSAKRNGNQLPLILSLKSIQMGQIKSLWPKGLEHLNITDWMTQRLSGGVINNISFVAPFVKEGSKWTLQKPKATFDFTAVNVDYFAPLAPVINGFGTVRIENDILRVNIGSGTIGGMKAEGGFVEITNLSNPEPTMVNIEADIASPLQNILNYIYTDPISLREQIKFDPKFVRGDTKANVKISLPATDDVKIEDIKVAVNGTVNNIFIPKLIRNLDLTGGAYDVTVADGEFKFKGKGQLGGRSGNFEYKEFLNHDTAPYIADLTANIDTDADLRRAFGVNLDMFIDGSVPTNIRYKQNKDKHLVIDIEANLTNARFIVPPLKYEKPKGQSGFATATAMIKGDDIHSIENLKITIGKDEAQGSLQFGKLGNSNDIVSGNFPRVVLNNGAHNFILNLKQPTSNNFNVTITGQSVDARPFLGNKNNVSQTVSANSSSSANASVTVTTETIKTGDKEGQYLQNPKLKIDVNGSGDIRLFDLTATVPDKSKATMSIKPNAQNLLALNVSAQNAGSFLYAMGMYETMRGGTLEINATQIRGAGLNDFRGSAEISKFKIIQAPVLAQLINAFSLSGLGNLLGDEGINFGRLNADFDWRNSKDGRVISLRNGKTKGASIGLTFGGVVNQDKNTMNLSGTFVPVSDVNKLVSRIPIVGELLTGGKDGGIIAATYAVKGSTKNPEVIINPLSVLAPGFLRSILFEGGTTLPQTSPSKTPKERTLN